MTKQVSLNIAKTNVGISVYLLILKSSKELEGILLKPKWQAGDSVDYKDLN